ncbi:MAG TPA: ASKHA domain-containing protein [Myxococcota bacterium]|nr:ASKHA domain-containing protein [Myxococcota bacterium]
MAQRSTDALVVFTPSGKRGRFPIGTSVLGAARELGVDIDSVCGGRGICGRCKCLVAEGEFAKFGIRSDAAHLNPITEPELRFSRREALPPGFRLTCHAKLEGDVVIDVPASSQVHHQVVRKEYESRAATVDPVIHLHYVQVAEPRLDEPRGDLERLLDALRSEWQLADLRCALHVIRRLQRCLREGGWYVTVAVREARDIVGVWPGFKDRIFGVAIDVGSTTVAAHLCDLASGEVLASAGVMNPQFRFGEDLMSRVSYVMLNPGGDREMTRAVRAAIDELIGRLCAQVGATGQDVFELTLVGNPIMHHLLLGISPVELGTAPFALAVDSALNLAARDLDLSVAEGARAYVFPCIAGHVGADTAAMLLAEAPWEADRITLLVDVGTNAEIVLGNGRRLLAASSPTGPAFEGAQISCGQRAAPGAIERVRIDPDTLEPRIRVIGCELWSDEPGFEQAVAEIGITGICGTGIIEVVAELFLAGVIDREGRIDGALRARSSRIVQDERTFRYVLHDGTPTISVTQNDVRAIQLAKGALYAGVRLLMDHLGVERVDRIRLAGAFGSHIDVKYAMVLGMIPDCELSNVSSAGNAAGTGAVAALLDKNARGIIEARVRTIEKIETAVEPAFQQHFVHAMAIPNGLDAFTELAKQVKLPAPRTPAESDLTDTGRRRNRRRSRGG